MLVDQVAIECRLSNLFGGPFGHGESASLAMRANETIVAGDTTTGRIELHVAYGRQPRISKLRTVQRFAKAELRSVLDSRNTARKQSPRSTVLVRKRSAVAVALITGQDPLPDSLALAP